MDLEIIKIERPVIEKPKKTSTVTARDVAVAFGKMEINDAIFIPGERRQAYAVAAFFVAISRGGNSKTFKGSQNGVDGYYYQFMAA